jgi:hypothetical protein
VSGVGNNNGVLDEGEELGQREVAHLFTDGEPQPVERDFPDTLRQRLHQRWVLVVREREMSDPRLVLRRTLPLVLLRVRHGVHGRLADLQQPVAADPEHPRWLVWEAAAVRGEAPPPSVAT